MIRGRIRAAACGSAPMLPFILRDTGIDRSGKSHYNTEGYFVGNSAAEHGLRSAREEKKYEEL